MQMDNISARAIQSKIAPAKSKDNLNIIQFAIPRDPLLAKVQQLHNLPPCPSVKNCFSSKKDNPFNCPSYSGCSNHKHLLGLFA